MQSESPLLSEDGCGLGGLQRFPSSHRPCAQLGQVPGSNGAEVGSVGYCWGVGLGSRWTGQPPLGLPWIKPPAQDFISLEPHAEEICIGPILQMEKLRLTGRLHPAQGCPATFILHSPRKLQSSKAESLC